MSTLRVSMGLAVVLSLQSVGVGETVADRKGAILKDRATLENDPRWIYNDYERAFAEGRRTGKPVLAVLRCVPCLACAGIDAQVLLEKSELAPLLEQFVCVRVINANALDLARFQFDFDLSFSAMVFNGDGTVYGRFGSWAHQKDPKEGATDGFRRVLESALAIHKGYPGNRAELDGKQGKATAYRTPVDMPKLKGKYGRTLDWDGKLVASCVHCHQLGDAMREEHRSRGERIPSQWVFPYPGVATLGLEFAAADPLRVVRVASGSAAARGGVLEGDRLEAWEGQRVISEADVSWVLHHAAEAGELRVAARRGDALKTLVLPLDGGWREHSDISRRVGTWGMRAMALGGMLLEDLTVDERRELGLKPGELALRAKHVGEYGQHATAKKAGVKKQDIVVGAAGWTERMTEGELIGRLIREYRVGDKVKFVLLRGGTRVEVEFPMQ